jgi:uncharacterized protein (TIGR02246 family)
MLKRTQFLAGGLAAALAIGALSARGPQEPVPKQPAAADDKARAADRAAIQTASREFATAFNKGDAKAVAALWTEQGECYDAAGEPILGRAAIEQAFAEFFKDNPRAKIETLIASIRFPAPDLAVEEGTLRRISTGNSLPATTLYSVTHVRDGGRWRVAVSREWGAGQDRLEDLDWLVGQWKAPVQDEEVVLTFTRDGRQPVILGQFTRQARGRRAETGTMRIALDPQTGQLRSWNFDADGGHGQSLWIRDGNSWVMDCVGVLGAGIPTASVNILNRVSNDEITWRSIDRVMGEVALPDTVPVRLTRVAKP